MNYTNYLIIPNASLDTVALPKYVFNTYTYKEQEATGTRQVAVPKSEDVTELKAQLATLEIEVEDMGMPEEMELSYLQGLIPTEYVDETYTYMEEVVDKTILNKPTWQEAIDRNPQWYAPRTVGTHTIIKDQFSMLTGDVSALYALGKKKPIGTFTLMNHDEILRWVADNEVVEEI